MKKMIKKILKWILHDHDLDDGYRITTYCEVLKKGEWKEDIWIEIKWYKTCKSCGKVVVQKFKSSLPYPNKIIK